MRTRLAMCAVRSKLLSCIKLYIMLTKTYFKYNKINGLSHSKVSKLVERSTEVKYQYSNNNIHINLFLGNKNTDL